MNKEWKNFCAKLTLLSAEDCKNILDCPKWQNTKEQSRIQGRCCVTKTLDP